MQVCNEDEYGPEWWLIQQLLRGVGQNWVGGVTATSQGDGGEEEEIALVP